MCGRFAQYSPANIIKEDLEIDEFSGKACESYNISPGSSILAVIMHDKLKMGNLEWGFVVPWEKIYKSARKHINARAETIAQKSSFKGSLKKRRCLIPANGYYEWQGEKGKKLPWYISPVDEAFFYFAGIWNTWKGGDGEKHHTCAIITRSAVQSLSHIHHRMPVILNKDNLEKWLDPSNNIGDELLQILNSSVDSDLQAWPVSKFVNGAENTSSTCIDKIL